MNSLSRTLYTALVLLIAAASLASASALNARPVTINGSALQAYLDGKGQTITVNTDQIGNALWTTTASHNSTFTLMLELSGNASGNSVGIYNDGATSTLFQIFPGSAAAGWFAVTTFDVGQPGKVVVNLFDQTATWQGQTTYMGVNSASFGFYISGPNGTYFTEDDENGGSPQNVVYMGTGTSTGNFWLCWEDSAYSTGDQDFDDFVVFLESVNQPMPVLPSTWGQIKGQYRSR